jgi:hypothetical protein
MTQKQIEALVQLYLGTASKDYGDFNVERGRLSADEEKGTWLALSDRIDGTVSQLKDHDYSKVAPTVMSFFQRIISRCRKTRCLQAALPIHLVIQQQLFKIWVDAMETT